MKQYKQITIEFSKFDVEDMLMASGINQNCTASSGSAYGTLSFDDFKNGSSSIDITAVTNLNN